MPAGFGYGSVIPLIKDKMGNLNDEINYRPITLIPVISKVFGCILLGICQDWLMVDDLQFGFKQGHGCTDVIFALKSGQLF